MKSENCYDLVLLVLKYFVHYQMKNKMGQLAFFSIFHVHATMESIFKHLMDYFNLDGYYCSHFISKFK